MKFKKIPREELCRMYEEAQKSEDAKENFRNTVVSQLFFYCLDRANFYYSRISAKSNYTEPCELAQEAILNGVYPRLDMYNPYISEPITYFHLYIAAAITDFTNYGDGKRDDNKYYMNIYHKLDALCKEYGMRDGINDRRATYDVLADISHYSLKTIKTTLEKMSVSVGAMDESVENKATDYKNPESEYFSREDSIRIQKALDTLNPLERYVVQRRVVDGGVPYKTIAVELRKSESWILEEMGINKKSITQQFLQNIEMTAKSQLLDRLKERKYIEKECVQNVEEQAPVEDIAEQVEYLMIG